MENVDYFEELTDDGDFLEMIREVEEGLRRIARRFRTREHHFEKWMENEFFDRFRISKGTAREVLNQIVIASPTKRSKALFPEDMLLITLRYFATGSMLIVAGDFSGVHKSTASRVVYRISRAIARLKNNYIEMPETEEEKSEVRLNFYKLAKFPKCIGALDCTHVKLQSPGGETAETFRNRKGCFSFDVQCICDSSLTVRNIVCRWPGSTHDSTIWNNSRIRAEFENGEMGDNVLVGDSGYPITQYLITPFLNPRTPEENLFNESQIRTRNPIERFFGIWKRRFPILVQGIRLKVQRVEAIVVATAVLQNIALKNADPLPPPLDENLENLIEQMDSIDTIPVPEVIDPVNVNDTTRQRFVEYFGTLR